MNDDNPAIQITASQVELIVPLFDAYRQFYHQPADLVEARRFLTHRVSNHESVIFGVLENGQALGFTQLYPSFSSISLKPIWVLNDLFVAPEYRGRGIATRLIQAAQLHAKTTGAVRLSLSTGIENRVAQNLYERLGWHRISGFFFYEITVPN